MDGVPWQGTGELDRLRIRKNKAEASINFSGRLRQLSL
jgi:hypothetical protein